MPIEEAIPEDTNMILDKSYKYIMSGSFVLYQNPDNNLFYPCRVTAFSSRNSVPKLLCQKLGAITAEWEHLFPIEAYDLVKDKAKVYGFKEYLEVTLDELRKRINCLRRKA